MTKINGKLIYLQSLNANKHATLKYSKWLNNPKVNKYLETRKATTEDLKRYINEKNNNKNCLLLGIFSKESNEHIGNIKLEPISFNKKEATIGILIGEKNYWGKGIGTEAIKLSTNYAFDKLGLKKISLGVIPENKAAIRAYEKCGFTIDKIEKKVFNHEGTLYDNMYMSIKKS